MTGVAEILEMSAGDALSATRVATQSGWSNMGSRFAFFVEHPACLAVVAVSDGETVGAACGAANGDAGWIGLVVVSPAHRGRGLGAALTRAVMERLYEAGCRTLLLTATESGRPVYEKLGFEVETFYHGFEARGLASGLQRGGELRDLGPEDMEAVLALDREATGEDRSALLRASSKGRVIYGPEAGLRGYHASVPWGGGPTIAVDERAGLSLLDLQRRNVSAGGNVRAWLTTENEAGRKAVERAGFVEVKCLPRMVLGEPLDWRPEALWGVFSLAKG